MTSITNPEPNMLALAGEVDLHESPVVREALQRILEKKPSRLFIDLTSVTYIDSSGLATLIEAMQRVNAYDGKLALFGLQDNVSNIFHIARLDQVFRIFPNKVIAAEALA